MLGVLVSQWATLSLNRFDLAPEAFEDSTAGSARGRLLLRCLKSWTRVAHSWEPDTTLTVLQLHDPPLIRSRPDPLLGERYLTYIGQAWLNIGCRG
jgi:hypothetical protein